MFKKVLIGTAVITALVSTAWADMQMNVGFINGVNNIRQSNGMLPIKLVNDYDLKNYSKDVLNACLFPYNNLYYTTSLNINQKIFCESDNRCIFRVTEENAPDVIYTKEKYDKRDISPLFAEEISELAIETGYCYSKFMIMVKVINNQ